MEGWELAVIAAGAAGTAALSAVAGLGGGLVLLVLLLQFMDPRDAIPVHGAIQIVSNGTRAFALKGHVQWGVVRRHGLLLIPGGWLGLQLTAQMPRSLGRGLIGIFALVATWRPSLLAPPVQGSGGRFPRAGFLWVGAAHGAINMPLGATGPLIAPFFRAALGDRREVVATFAAAQVTGHIVKIGLFGWAGFQFGHFLPVMAVGAAGVWAGSLAGTRLLHRVSERAFGWLFRTVVTAAAIPLVIGWLLP